MANVRSKREKGDCNMTIGKKMRNRIVSSRTPRTK